jgi:hypothetical protein
MGEAPTISIDIYKPLLEPNSVRTIMIELNYQTAVICAEWTETWRACITDEPRLLAESLQFMQKFQQLDSQFDVWMQTSRPVDWVMEKVHAPERGMPGWLRPLYDYPGAPTVFHNYENYYVVHRWTNMRATRIVILEKILTTVDILDTGAISEEARQHFGSVKNELETRLIQIVDSVCEAVYSMLTIPLCEKPEAQSVTEVVGLRGYSLLWPLYKSGMVMRRASLRKRDVHGTAGWLRRALQFVADEVGIGKAQAFLNNIDGKYGVVFS